eukprot:3569560-Rhodomonas_salina.1
MPLWAPHGKKQTRGLPSVGQHALAGTQTDRGVRMGSEGTPARSASNDPYCTMFYRERAAEANTQGGAKV